MIDMKLLDWGKVAIYEVWGRCGLSDTGLFLPLVGEWTGHRTGADEVSGLILATVGHDGEENRGVTGILGKLSF
jgi:hypothetical protein